MCIKPIIEDSIAMNRWSWSNHNLILLRNIPTKFKEYLLSKYSAEIVDAIRKNYCKSLKKKGIRE